MNPSSDDIAERLLKWLAVDSTSGNEREFLQLLEGMFHDDGWQITRQPVEEDRWNLLVTDGTDPQVLLSTHVDTVPPVLEVDYDGQVVRGRGACDTKGGLLAMVHAARRVRDAGIEGVGFLLVVGEEVDHRGAKEATALQLDVDRIILCEPTQNRVVTAQKGMVRCTLRTRGVAGHSAFPDDGESAVGPLLDALEAIRGHDWPTDELLGATTVNIGVIDAGVAANVFAPEARAEVLFRAVSDAEQLLHEVRSTVGGDVEMVDVVYNDPVFFDVPSGVDTCTVPFNTDAPYLADIADVWLVGPGDIRCAHSEDEQIRIGEIFDGIELYEKLIQRVL